jgi:hypothetical protein
MNERADVASAGQTMPGSPEGSLAKPVPGCRAELAVPAEGRVGISR